MDQVANWAVGEVKKLMPGGILEDEDIKQMVQNLINLDAVSINEQISGLLDYSQKEVKKFIKEFIERVENQRKYEQKASKVKQQTDKAKASGVQQKQTTVRDLSKVRLTNRTICYCQCTKHPLVNNCVSCGKIVCEQEGEGPCLFCGAWVDRETMYDVNELGEEDENGKNLGLQYEIALQHRDKLIEYDVNAAKRLGVIDERSDWYELSNNTWLNKDQRNYASQMLDIEKKRAEEIDSKMNVEIDLETGQTKLRIDEADDAFSIDQQQKDVNNYIQDQMQGQKQASFRPFEAEDGDFGQILDVEAGLKKIGEFSFKSAPLNDEKSQKLFAQLNPQQAAREKKEKAAADIKAGNKRQGKPFDQFEKKMGISSEGKPACADKLTFLQSSLSQRLQTENPFDEFREAVEKAMIQKSKEKSRVFPPDQDFFREQDDQGMCLSMHQPWASLLVHGFKRFEGRMWNTKYRGPLWIHATSQKPKPEDIEQLEVQYRKHYEKVGQDLPPFPERYITSSVIGRVDLVDVISLEEYTETVPSVLREITESAFQFVVRNPMFLDMPMKMAGQPSVYKMPKEIAFGARPLLKKAGYTWWPLKEFKQFTVGMFDLHPLEAQHNKLKKLLETEQRAYDEEVGVPMKINDGVYHIKKVLNLAEQQHCLEAIRELNVTQQSKYKFLRVTPPTASQIQAQEDSLYTEGVKRPFVNKQNCYQMELTHKEVPEFVKGLPLSLESALNATSQHLKAQYKKYRIDFYLPQGFSEEKEEIPLKEEKRKNKSVMAFFFICIGSAIEIEYTLSQEGLIGDYQLVLESGDAFMIDNKVKSFSFRVSKVLQSFQIMKDLVLRDGALVLKFEKE